MKIANPIQICEIDWNTQQDFTGLYLVSKKDPQKTIKKGMNIIVELNKIRFEKDNFSCLAKII